MADNLNLDRYSIDALKASVTPTFLRCAEARAAAESRELTKTDLASGVYRSPDGRVNLPALRAALEAVPTMPFRHVDRLKIETQLQVALTEAEAEAGIQVDRLASLEIAPRPQPVREEAPVARSYMAELDAIPIGTVISLSKVKVSGATAVSRAPEVVARPGAADRINELIEAARQAGMRVNSQIAQNPFFRTQLLSYAASEEGIERMAMLNSDLGAKVAQMMDTVALAKAPVRAHKLNLEAGCPSPDYRPLPNYRKLGITRAGGPAIASEMRYARGQTRNDGTPVTVDDFYSVGALLANNDIIAKYQAYIPEVELGRMGWILETRSKKSDEDHSRRVQSGHFTIIDPSIGTDEGCKLNIHHPRLGKSVYTAILARLLFPIQEYDKAQKAAVESVRRGRLQNQSIAFNFDALSCGLCGEMTIGRTIVSNGMITGFTVDPEANSDLFCERGEDDYFGRMRGTLRMPAKVEGGYLYRDIMVLNCDERGNVQIDPLPAETLDIRKNTVFLAPMMDFFWGFSFCRLHGLNGYTLRDGRKTIGMVTNMSALINSSFVDAGAINDARVVNDPDVDY